VRTCPRLDSTGRGMGLELYMVGVIVEDMARAAEFYRRLGVDVPEDTESLDPDGNTILLSASADDG
jgi:catechol 2,3-dioxygenase-like lactoylglutathione lyase family enzyme